MMSPECRRKVSHVINTVWRVEGGGWMAEGENEKRSDMGKRFEKTFEVFLVSQ